MSIDRGSTPLRVYKGDYKPENFYRGEDKLAGWHEETKQGESVSFTGTYNDRADVVVGGNSVQNGTPAPNYPADVKGVDGDLVSSIANINLIDNSHSLDDIDYNTVTDGVYKIALPELNGLTMKDTYNPNTGEHVQRVGVKVFDGSESGWWERTESIYQGNGFYTYQSRNFSGNLPDLTGLCTHYVQNNDRSVLPTSDRFRLADWGDIWIIQFTTNKYQTLDAFKQALSLDPVTVYYPLPDPTPQQLTPVTVPTFPLTTVIEQTGDIKGNITATVKVND